MAAARGVWAIDIGTTSLKALRLTQGAEGIEVIGFSHIEHSHPLTAEGVGLDEKEQIISDTLQKFLEDNDISKEEVGISIAGQNSFSRFIKLPPVEPKKIPEIVQFEAVQQIPFDINEVEWDWQLMENENSPDKEVGLFAIKNELISEVMDHFTKEKLRVSCVQIAPMALYNFVYYDRSEVSESGDKATIVLDMGAENTTLVICTKDSVWQRSIRIGGNTFTQAIADTFKKNFTVAEKLKRTAPMSKYMRQIYTAMKPVYTDLGSEIQRSLGFYSSSPQGRDKNFSKMIAMGGGMKLQGLAKYLTQTLGMTVVKPDSFERLELSPDISSAQFHENVSDFGVVYGLGAQLMGEAKIRTNLLPRRIARAMAWTRKARMFTIAASILLLVMVLGLGKAFKDLKQYQSHKSIQQQNKSAVSQVQTVKREISEQEARKQPLIDQITKEMNRFKYRDVLPKFNAALLECLPNAENTPSQADLFQAYKAGNIQAVRAIPRSQRKQLFVTQIDIEYTGDLESATFPTQGSRSGYRPAGRRTAVRNSRVSTRDEMLNERGGPARPPAAAQTMTSTQTGTTTQQTGPGFTVVIEGYSPYQQISELLDPPMVGDDQNRWGIVTRFENFDKLFQDMPFELFHKHEIANFQVETGLVDLQDADMPAGIGILKEIERVPLPETATANDRQIMPRRNVNIRNTTDFIYTETVLVDPMTGEEISKTYDIVTQRDVDADPDLTERDLGRIKIDAYGNEQYVERDHWFRIKAKFIWKDAPAPAQPAGGDVMDQYRGRGGL